MSAWDLYPSTYRSEEVQKICTAVKAGECVSLIGLSGAGKSNLLGFLAHRVNEGPAFLLIDCNNLTTQDLPEFFRAVIEAGGGISPQSPSLRDVVREVGSVLKIKSDGLCLLIDRFDPFNTSSTENAVIASNLRSLRDNFKYNLTFVIATRKPLDSQTELAELITGNTIWLGPLNREDSVWSIKQYAIRKNANWDKEAIDQIYTISRGYPSMLRAVCEAYSTGVPLDESALRNSPIIQRRVSEFWSDQPSDRSIRNCRLTDHPLLFAAAPVQMDAAELTAAEQRLLDYFYAHLDQLCEKDELIQAIWPDEKVTAGLRDDSLAQLVHRLRDKLGVSGKEHIQTIPRRGYRFVKSFTNE